MNIVNSKPYYIRISYDDFEGGMQLTPRGNALMTNGENRILIIGGGISGISAALDLANQGHEVILVERDPTIGGHMARLDKTFPTLDCAICIISPKMV